MGQKQVSPQHGFESKRQIGMKKKTKSLLYILCIAMIVCAVLWWLGLTEVEGFQASGWAGAPFISGQAFKDLCKYNLDNRYALVPFDSSLKQGDKVFLKVSDLASFVEDPPPVKVIIVISNSDETFDDNLYNKVAPYVSIVYAINCSAKRAIQIPIGFRDDAYTPHKDLTDILSDTTKSSGKDIICLLNFLIVTNVEERQAAYDAFLGKPWVQIDEEYKKTNMSKSLDFNDPQTINKRLDCYATLKKTKFVVCPPGRGIDTHRVYETLFFGGIPIIKTSPLDPMYKKLGGCWIVQDWSEVTEEACNERWVSMAKGAIKTDPMEWLK